MIESIYKNLFSRGLVTESFEDFSYGFNNDANFRQRIVNDFPDLVLPQAPKYEPVQQESQEQKNILDKVPLIGDFLGDLYRAGEAGLKQGSSVGETIELMNQKFGSQVTDEEIQDFISAYNESTNLPTSDEMMDFNRIYEEEGKGIWGFIKGVANNPTIAPQVFVSSMAALARSSVESEELTAATAAGAAAGSFVPLIGTAAGGLGALATGMESALTFAELLKEKVGEENFNLENVRKVLENEKDFDDIYQKAVSRGVAIGAIEGLTGGLAGKAATGARRAVRTLDKATGAAAGLGVEAVGGGLGEVAGRLAADQEMDIAEIGFEAIGGTATAPLTIGGALRQKQGQYTINNQKFTGNEFIKRINTLSPQTLLKAIPKIKVENDAEIQGILDDKYKDAVYDAQIDEKVKDVNDRKEIVKLEKDFAAIKDQTSVSGNIKAAEIRNQIKSILGKYGKYYGDTADVILQGGINIHKAFNLTDNLAKTKAFAGLLKMGYKEFNTDQEYNDFIDEYNAQNNTKIKKSAEGQILQNPETGEQTILINKERAAKSGQFTVGQHELLHGLLFETLKDNDDAAINLGRELKTYLDTINVETISDSKFKKRLSDYREQSNFIKKELKKRKATDSEIKTAEAEFYEEVITLTSEAMANNELKYDQTIMDKIADAIRQFLQKHFNANIELNSGKDVFNFIKDYNKSFDEGVLLKSFGRLSSQGLQGKLVNTESGKKINSIVSKNKIADYNIADADRKALVNNAYEARGKDAINDIIPYYLPKIEAVVNQRRDYTISDLDIADITEEKADIVQETAMNLTMHAYAFDPTKNKDLDAYLNSYVVMKFGTAVKKIQKQETKITEAQERKALKVAEQTTSEVTTQAISEKVKLDEPTSKKLKNIVDEAVTKSVKLIAVGTKPKQVQSGLAKTFRGAIAKDLKNTIKNKDAYKKFLQDNFETFYNDVNVETLNKRFRGDKTNPDLFVEPVIDPETGKQKRYTKTKTSQPGIFQKKPWDEVKDIYLDYFLEGPASRVGVRKDKIVQEMSNYMGFEMAQSITSSSEFKVASDIVDFSELQAEQIIQDAKNATNIRAKLKLSLDEINKYEDKIIDIYKEFNVVQDGLNTSELYENTKENILSTIPEADRKKIKEFVEEYEYVLVKPQVSRFTNYVKNKLSIKDKQALEIIGKSFAAKNEVDVKSITKTASKLIKSFSPTTLKQMGITKANQGKLEIFGLVYKNLRIKDLSWNTENKYSVSTVNALQATLNKKDIDDPVFSGKLQLSEDYNYAQHTTESGKGLSKKIHDLQKSKDADKLKKLTSGELAKQIAIANENNPKLQVGFNLKIAKILKQAKQNNDSQTVADIYRLLQGTTNAKASVIKGAAVIKFVELKNNTEQFTEPNSRQYVEHLSENVKNLEAFDLLNEQYADNKINDEQYIEKGLKIANNIQISLNDSKNTQYMDSIDKVLDKGVLKLNAIPSENLSNFYDINGNNANNVLADIMLSTAINNEITVSTRAMSKLSLDDQVNKFKNYDKALQMANRLNPPAKGISILDFDDTLAKTKSNVLYTLPDGTKGKINATEFAEKSSALEAAGAKFDFSEFSEVKRGKKGPFFNKAKELKAKFGNKDIFILTARPQDAAPAIQKFLKAVGLNIKLENIVGLEDGRPEAKAEFIVDKAAEGYNDFLFADDAIKNVKAVNEVLQSLDIKGKVYQVKQNFRQDLDKKFNKIIAANKGIDPNAVFSEAAAKVRGAKSDKFWSRLFVPPSAEDFKGLLYMLVGKGKIGETQMSFLEEALIKPFAKAYRDMDAAKEKISVEYKALTTEFKDVKKKLLTATDYNNFTFDQAIRVYTMVKNGIEVPGISKRDKNALVKIVQSDPKLVNFSDKLSTITGLEEGYIVPTDTSWLASTIEMDMKAINNDVRRSEFLNEWIENKNIIFSENNLNKLEALYGTSYRAALEDIIYRMETGSNRQRGNNKLVNQFTDWINNAVGNIMFLNVRSSILQTISFTNFVNWSDNNPLKYMAAVGNFPQFTKDFAMIWNSDFLKQRRKGLQTDVSAAEIMNQAANSKNKVGAMISYILGKGYLPTQMGDSFAICMGGAGFYRNRVDTYLKQGLSQAEAESKAFDDFRETSEDAQQSARPDKISAQQAGPLGRFILAFQNTPMQYTRMIKKAALDLANGRGDAKTNISKIVYYGAMQNLIFSALQNALFAIAFDDEEEEKTKERYARIANNMSDTILRGTGIYGAAASTLKNIALQFIRQEKKGSRADHAYTIIEGVNLSPPVGSKIRKLYSATQAVKFNRDDIKNMGFHIDNPAYDAVANTTSALTNIPVDRALRITDNARAALDKNNQTWQRVALALGWNTWDVGIEPPGKKKKKQTGGIKLY